PTEVGAELALHSGWPRGSHLDLTATIWRCSHHPRDPPAVQTIYPSISSRVVAPESRRYLDERAPAWGQAPVHLGGLPPLPHWRRPDMLCPEPSRQKSLFEEVPDGLQVAREKVWIRRSPSHPP